MKLEPVIDALQKKPLLCDDCAKKLGNAVTAIILFTAMGSTISLIDKKIADELTKPAKKEVE